MSAMKSRAPALAIALILALLATGGVFLYVQSVRHTASTGGGMVSVIVSKQDIPAGTRLDGLVSGGMFTTVSVPRANLVPGVVTDANQLQGHTMFHRKLGLDLYQFDFRCQTFATDGQLVFARWQCTNGESACFVSFERPVHTRRFTNDHACRRPYTAASRVRHLKPQLTTDPLGKCKGCANTKGEKK